LTVVKARGPSQDAGDQGIVITGPPDMNAGLLVVNKLMRKSKWLFLRLARQDLLDIDREFTIPDAILLSRLWSFLISISCEITSPS
jgi:hypothetical protein